MPEAVVRSQIRIFDDPVTTNKVAGAGRGGPGPWGDINPEPERVSGGQWSGPGGVWFASWPTASVMRRQTAALL
jgi:hypothetical protein